MRRFLPVLLAIGVALAPRLGHAADAQEPPKTIAAIDFVYVDTSGEDRDQSREHQARLSAFMAAFRADLAKNGAYRVVEPKCQPDPCASSSPAENLLAASRAAGADIMLVGGVHKMSTLVQWAEVETIDAKSGRSLGKKLFTFRGDTDDAWRRAEKFILEEVLVPSP